MELLRICPTFRAGHLFYAEWHYQEKNYGPALDGYEEALRLGVARPKDYLRASLAASFLRQTRKALSILESAESALGRSELSGVMFFNMACYYTRLGKHAKAIEYLQHSIRAGFRKRDSFLKDKDLAPLRSKPEFQRVLKRLQISQAP